MKLYFKKNKGFTLIELLVTISIISLLSSIVFTVLGSARVKAKDAVIKQEVSELSKLMDMEYNDNGKYDNLQPTNGAWVTRLSSCSAYFNGPYATQAQAICNKIIANSPTMGTDGNSGDVFMIWNYFDIHQRYSIVAALNNGKDFCVSDSAASSGNTTWFNGWDGSSPPPFGTKGCMYNP